MFDAISSSFCSLTRKPSNFKLSSEGFLFFHCKSIFMEYIYLETKIQQRRCVIMNNISVAVDPNAHFPDADMTDEKWQVYFTALKNMIKPVGKRYMSGIRDWKTGGDYVCSQQCRYRAYINDVLRNIRHHGTDFCYYIYQISDLLRYEPALKAMFNEQYQCFMVSC